MSIALIAGLGNPGAEYRDTRHNIGFVVVDALARALGASWSADTRHKADVARTQTGGSTVMLARPRTFMNHSGEALGPLLRYYKLPASALCIVYDDITLAPGALKIAQRGGTGGHNGVESVLRHTGEGFTRYRIGIGGKTHPEMDLKDYVLGKFTPEERATVEARLPALVEGLRLLLRLGPTAAMNRLNRRAPERAAPPANKTATADEPPQDTTTPSPDTTP